MCEAMCQLGFLCQSLNGEAEKDQAGQGCGATGEIQHLQFKNASSKRGLIECTRTIHLKGLGLRLARWSLESGPNLSHLNRSVSMRLHS